jgi:predicted enzyme related to lactoylglutathione lyase
VCKGAEPNENASSAKRHKQGCDWKELSMNLIAHVEIPVADLTRAMRFYRTVFDIEFGDVVEIHESRMAYFPFQEGKDGASGALAQGDVYVPTRHGAIVYLSIENIDDVLVKAVACGGEVLFPKTPVNEEIFVAEIADSEGNRIAVQSRRSGG